MSPEPEVQGKQPVDGPHVRFEDALLDNLVGKWIVSRKMSNRAEENVLTAEWILNHQFLQIHMIDVKSPPRYEALVLIGYNHEQDRYVIHWLDTFGGRYSDKGMGTRNGNEIRFVFQDEEGVVHNSFTWNPESRTWRSLIEQTNEQGQWTFFLEDQLQRP